MIYHTVKAIQEHRYRRPVRERNRVRVWRSRHGTGPGESLRALAAGLTHIGLRDRKRFPASPAY
jgi:hypothetical protein